MESNYYELIEWAAKWLDGREEPFPIDGVCIASTDARYGVQSNLLKLQDDPENQEAKRRLIELKKLIEQGPADLSKYGW